MRHVSLLISRELSEIHKKLFILSQTTIHLYILLINTRHAYLYVQ